MRYYRYSNSSRPLSRNPEATKFNALGVTTGLENIPTTSLEAFFSKMASYSNHQRPTCRAKMVSVNEWFGQSSRKHALCFSMQSFLKDSGKKLFEPQSTFIIEAQPRPFNPLWLPMKHGMTRDHPCSIFITLAAISMFLYLRNTEPTGLLRHNDVLYWATMITLPCNTGCGTRTGLLQSLPRV